MFDTKPYEMKIAQAIEHFKDELKKIRTGRAHPGMLSSVFVEVYGTKMPLNQVGNITAPEPQLLQITPFDPSNVAAISEAIRQEVNLGLNPSDDGRIVRIPVPQLTEERRRQLVKQLGDKVEECRITIRTIRQDGIKAAKSMKNNKDLGEDDYTRVEKDLDKNVAEAQEQIDAITAEKQKEVMTI
jgi:ribosome recycling factor